MTKDMLHDFVCSGAKTIMHNNLSPHCEKTWSRCYKTFSFSTRLSMKFNLLINIELSKINGIFRFKLPKRNRKAMNRNWSNQKANPALKTKTGNK